LEQGDLSEGSGSVSRVKIDHTSESESESDDEGLRGGHGAEEDRFVSVIQGIEGRRELKVEMVLRKARLTRRAAVAICPCR
jgi:hypothetical protein